MGLVLTHVPSRVRAKCAPEIVARSTRGRRQIRTLPVTMCPVNESAAAPRHGWLWRGLAAVLAVMGVYLLTEDSGLLKGTGLWLLGFAFAAWRQSRPVAPVDMSQRAAFRQLALIAGGLAVAGLAFVVFAVVQRERMAVGGAVLCLGFALMVSIPAYSAFKRRDSTEPWGTNGP